MKPDEIRSEYLSFFEGKDHQVVNSAPVVPQGDPTLLFTNAGMNQFKDLLLGNEKRDYTRAASSQKCIRAGGKHNDLDEVGQDGRHLTFFEMLGNWSFGDYYKRESILWAWEFITTVLDLDQSRLYVTVYKDDDESYDIWANEVGFPKERIARQGNVEEGDEENFWSMGDTGPCGPCTEIHYDLHPEDGPFTFAQNAYDEDRIMEFWNLVFMEFNRNEDGEFLPLPMKSVDTGMGLERMAIMKAGVDNVFMTDLFNPILEKTASLLNIDLPNGASDLYTRDDFATFCIIADHIRSATFALSDGATFSNEGRGSVLRSILRRAVRYGRQLGFDGPFMYKIAETVIEHYGDIYPELKTVGTQTCKLIRLDEERFFRTLDRGIVLFEKAAEEASTRENKQLSGEEVFELHATFGFPPDLTRVMAEEHNLTVDLEGYAKAWAEHQAVSRGKDLYAGVTGVEDWITVHEGSSSTFVGYNTTHGEALIRRYRTTDDDNGIDVLLSETPFYAESGGQVGDQGLLLSKDGKLEITIHNTQKTPIGIVHHGKITGGELGEEVLKETFITEVNREQRALTMSNHTATHLLHAALRDIVSDQIFQAGSLVSPDKLRFDFSHGQALTREQIIQIEDRVNSQIRHGHKVTTHEDVERDVAIEELGAMAIFGEKYDDHVRVVEIPGQSVELCGGTHVKNTSDINLFKITHESGVAAGIRRIEAVTNEAAYESYKLESGMLEEVNRILKSENHNLLERAKNIVEERAQLERQVKQLAQQLAQLRSADLVKDAQEVQGVKIIAELIKVDDRDQMLAYADKLREKLDKAMVLLGAELDGKPALLCMVTDPVFKEHKIKAGALINQAATHVNGKGGGRPTLAQAGGSLVEGLPKAIASFEEIAKSALS